MQFPRNKAKRVSAIVLVLLIASVVLMANVPNVPVEGAEVTVSGPLPAGKTPAVTVPTTASLSVRPHLVGLGQSVLINAWINPSGPGGRVFRDYKFTITKPDGTTTTFTTNSEPATSATWFDYPVDQVGTWKFKFDFPGCYCNGSSNEATQSAYYKPSSSPETLVTVQLDIVSSWPPAPLPTDYWTRPASLNNREWWPILGNWPGTGYQGGGPMWDALYPDTNPSYSTNYGFTPWVQGPNSAHILWKRLGAIAGLIGGPASIYSMTSGPGTPSLVYSGRCYQTVTKLTTQLVNGTYRTLPGSVAQCYDLRTGEIYYEIPTADGGVTPSYIAYLDPAQTALESTTWSVELLSLSGSRLYKVNPWTGAVTGNYSIDPLSMSGGIQAPGGGAFVNQIGGYVLNIQNIGNTTVPNYRLINWTTRGSSSTLASRIISNISSAWPLGIGIGGFIVNTATGGGSIHIDFSAGIAGFVGKDESPVTGVMMGTTVSAYSMKTGALLWGPVSLPDLATYSPMCVVADHGKIAFLTHYGYWLAYDLNTGKLAWKSEVMDYPWGTTSFGAYSTQSAYGMLFRQSYDGVYAIDWETGKIVWKYEAPTFAPFESPYQDADGSEVYSFNSGGIIADGKMYVANSEHTPTYPKTRGYGLHCINITTGEGIWHITGEQSPGTIADGYLTAANSWDGYMYVYGKGKSATTVTAPDVVVPKGTGVVIKGTVLDMSPAQPGTPCVSKESMTLQMEYLHMQQSIGGLWGNETMTGVPVNLLATAEDGSYIDIGTVTTDGYYGTFAKEWTPPAEGTYKIIATFAGDDSYGSSGAATAVTVGPAPATPSPTPEPPEAAPDNTPLMYGILLGVIAAIIIGLIALFRKR